VVVVGVADALAASVLPVVGGPLCDLRLECASAPGPPEPRFAPPPPWRDLDLVIVEVWVVTEVEVV